jgi:S-adenosylmethionine:tRNA ribosyltransferase-isomerase
VCQLDEFDYELPPESIAQEPVQRRDEARLMVMDRAATPDGAPALRHHIVRELPALLREGDLVVLNATRVLSARLVGRKPTGGAVEALLLGEAGGAGRFRAWVRSSGRQRVGQKFLFSHQGVGEESDRPGIEEIAGQVASPFELEAELVERGDRGDRGEVVLQFDRRASPYEIGLPPLPPYIRRSESDARRALDRERYQTIFARVPGAVAAPTAGLHFTPELLRSLDSAGIRTAEVVLHVGAGTFRPLSEEDLASGRLHAEAYCIPEETADAIAQTRARGGRVVAIGTTTTRVLETCADEGTGRTRGRAAVRAGQGETELFLRPGSRLRVVDALLTNFHLPRSSLLLLVAALAGREAVLAAYREAVARGYRFYSYGDAMLIR